MSLSNSSLHSKRNNNIVDQILEQGQRLRNSMVESILINDPLNTDVINYKYRYGNNNNSGTSSSNCTDDVQKALSIEEEQLFLAYIRGENMSNREQNQALDTLGKMSIRDVYNLTDRTCLSFKATCNCDICKAYYNNYNKQQQNVPLLNLQNLDSEKSDLETEKCSKPVANLIKYVDSLKISIHTLTFNREGLKKINKSSLKSAFKLPPSYMYTYFIEYSLPEIIIASSDRVRAKVDTGMHNNKVRFCSKLIHDHVIHFKQSTIHEIVHLDTLDLAKVKINFIISCRTQKQKGVSIIGIAQFLMSCFETTKYFTSNQELVIMLDCEAPIILGTLKVSLQLGCDKLYFGKEFIDAISLNKRKNVILSESLTENDLECQKGFQSYKSDTQIKDTFHVKSKISDEKCIANKMNMDNLRENIRKPSAELKHLDKENLMDMKSINSVKENANITAKQHIIFGFIYIPEAEFLNPLTSYIIVRLFKHDDSLYSRVIYNSSNPIYNFHQVIPYIYDDIFVQQLRDNFVIFEFHERCEEVDNLVGICKISLHKFYVSFRNNYIFEYLLQNEFPVIGADWWEPITDTLTGKIYGQVQILIAFGSEKQIHNLELNRGFCDDKVLAKKSSKISNALKSVDSQNLLQDQTEKICYTKGLNNKEKQKHRVTSSRNTKLKLNQINKVSVGTVENKKQDKAIQIDEKMENDNKPTENDSKTLNKDTLGEFLALLMQQRHTNNYVENSTNTEENHLSELNNPTTEVQNDSTVRETSQLLDTLQDALCVNSNTLFCNNATLNENRNSFKAHIHIDKALHLPAKKKCKVRKSKGKSIKQEDIPPSCYVTFETLPDEMKITPIIHRSCNPVWDFRCDIILPADLLFNNQKRLIFKIWKKCAGNSIEANLQTDIILGFAALDLTVFLAGLPTVSGWFNILDFSTKCNGQIKVDITPLENVFRFKEVKCSDQSAVNSLSEPVEPLKQKVDETKDETKDETLSRALKRKFIELDEITHRLRLRLSNVTNEDNDAFSDDLADEFERDINTLCVEDDYNMIDFEDENKKSHLSNGGNKGLLQIEINETMTTETMTSQQPNALSISAPEHGAIRVPKSGNLDKQLKEGKERIDTLLEKLSIIASENKCQSRHVSGCSTNGTVNTTANFGTLKDFVFGESNLGIEFGNNSTLFKNLFSADGETDRTTSEELSSDSGSSINVAHSRPAPDGARFNNDKV